MRPEHRSVAGLLYINIRWLVEWNLGGAAVSLCLVIPVVITPSARSISVSQIFWKAFVSTMSVSTRVTVSPISVISETDFKCESKIIYNERANYDYLPQIRSPETVICLMPSSSYLQFTEILFEASQFQALFQPCQMCAPKIIKTSFRLLQLYQKSTINSTIVNSTYV